MGASMSDDMIACILRGTTPEAQDCLLDLLTEFAGVWCNFDTVCQTPHRCRAALSTDHLMALRAALVKSLAGQPEPGSQPPLTF